MWKLRENALGKTWFENAEIIKRDLERLSNVCSGIISIEVGIDKFRTEQSYDVILISEFEDIDSFKNYSNHPEHLEVVDFIKQVVTSRIAVDY